MKFKNTKRTAPVIYENDRPHELDLFNFDVNIIPETEKQFTEFINDNKIIEDENWWEIQLHRCTYGYTIPDTIEDGGDLFPDDDKIVILDPKHPILEQHNVLNFKKGDRYIPHLRYHQVGNDLWIPPKMYFYLNFWSINRVDRVARRKIVGNPYFTDLSWENWMIRRRMFIEKKDHLWAKSRQRGLSEEEAANLSWFFMFLNDVQLAIVSGEDIYTQNTFKFVKRGLQRMKNTQFYKQIGVTNEKLLTSKNTGAEIHARTAQNNTQVLSGLSPFFTLLEEIGIWKKGFVKEVRDFLAPSQEATSYRTGYSTLIGTGGDVEDGVDDMEWILYNPREAGVLEFDNIYEGGDSTIGGFIPGWKFEVIDEEGNSDKDAGIKKLMKAREVKDVKKRYYAITLKPLKPSDIFGVSGSVYFGEIVKQNCLFRIAEIHNNRSQQIVKRYQIEWIDRSKPWKGVKAPIVHPDGPFLIAELPILGKGGKPLQGLYGGGTDSYDQDEALTSTSKGATVIKKGVDMSQGLDSLKIYNNFVALLLERPTANEGGRKVFYENSAKLCMLYGALNLIEYSKNLIFEFYKEFGIEGMLALNPSLSMATMVNDSKVTNKYGLHGSLIDNALVKLDDFWKDEQNVKNCFITEILRATSKFKRTKNYNCDITIACSLANLNLHEAKLVEEFNREIEKEPHESLGYKDSGHGLINTFAKW